MEDEEPGKTELLEGELTRLPPPERKHNRAGKRLLLPLDRKSKHIEKRIPAVVAGEAFQEMGYLLGRNPGSWLIPDVSLTWADQPGDKYYEGAPMIAFEIVSESNNPAYIARKKKKYLECGAAEVWVFYPKTRHAMVYTGSGERREETAFCNRLLPEIEIPFADFL